MSRQARQLWRGTRRSFQQGRAWTSCKHFPTFSLETTEFFINQFIGFGRRGRPGVSPDFDDRQHQKSLSMAAPDNQADWASRPKHQEAYRSPNQAELETLYRNSRLSLPWVLRLPLATTLSFFAGFTLGASYGGKMTGLRFRAEHAHKMPSSSTGWYLYHKSKNYQVAYGGLREGFRMGFKVSFWTTAMFAIERMFDVYRGTSDMFNTLTSCVTVAGGFSLWSMVHDVFASKPYMIPANTSALDRPVFLADDSPHDADSLGCRGSIWRAPRRARFTKGPPHWLRGLGETAIGIPATSAADDIVRANSREIVSHASLGESS